MCETAAGGNTDGIGVNDSNKIHILVFADDIILLGKDKQDAQKELNIVQDYLKNLGMSISGKRCLMFQVVSKKDTLYVKNPEIEVESSRILTVELKEAFRYLAAKIESCKGVRCRIIAPEILSTIKSIRKLSHKPG